MVNIKNALKETGIKGILIIDLCNKNGTILKKLGIFKDSSEIPNEIKMSDIFAKEENRSFSINLSYLTSNRQAPMGRLESSMHFYVDPEKFNLKEIKFGPDYKSVFDTTSFDIAPDFRIRKVDRKIRKEP
jgi:hypothetical protein